MATVVSAEISADRSVLRKRRVVMLLVLVISIGLMLFAWRQWLEEQAINDLQTSTANQLAVYAETVTGLLRRYEHLPYVLSQDETIVSLLTEPAGQSSLAESNNYLERVSREAGVEATFVLNTDGTATASSNWRDDTSFVGWSYAFRPYFRQAIENRSGEFFAIGYTTGKPGYFLSQAVERDGEILGVVVVKVSMEHLEAVWRDSGETVLVVDRHGIVLLSSRPEWKYRPLTELVPEVRRRMDLTKQFHNQPLVALDMRQLKTNGDYDIFSISDPDADGGQTQYLNNQRSLGRTGWSMQVLTPVERIRGQVNVATSVGVLLVLVLAAVATAVWQGRLRFKSKLAAAEALQEANNSLERRVEERTRELKQAQEGLIQAGKLAAIGQMSAAVAHEINQPLAAIRTYVATSMKYCDAMEIQRVQQNLGQIRDLTVRIARISKDLKTFSRKSLGTPETVSVRASIESATALMEPRLRHAGITLRLALDQGNLLILGDPIRLEQILVNLLSNAVNVLGGCERKEIKIELTSERGKAVIRLSDTGPGIPEGDMERIFDPFYTTSTTADSVGLGLALSKVIAESMHGGICAEKAEGGGAMFVIQIPLWDGGESATGDAIE